MGIPGMMLPNQGNQYQNDMGTQPMDLASVIQALTNPQLGNTSTMGNSNFQQQPIMQNVGYQQPQMQQPQMQNQVPQMTNVDPSAISGKIQQWLGAKPQDQGGQVQDILSGRFQQPNIDLNDVGYAAQATAADGKYVPAQQFANQRLATSMDALSKLATLQETQARGNMYQALAANGGGRGEGLAAANRMMQQYNSDPDVIAGKKPPLQFTQAYMAVTAKQGQGQTLDPNTGQMMPMAGAPQAVQTMANSKETGTQNAMIAAAAPKAAAEEGGKATVIGSDALAADASQSQNLIYTLKDLQDIGQKIQTGALADAKVQLTRTARAIGYPLSDSDISQLSNAQAFTKLSMNLVSAAAKQEGGASRLQAAFSALKDSNPNLGLEPETLPLITNFMGAQANKIISQQQAWDAAKSANPNLLYPDFERQYTAALSLKQQQSGGGLAPYNFNGAQNINTGTVSPSDAIAAELKRRVSQ